ncbi:hypothetical protein TNCT_492861 [Trichonephila clavata]|uniref:Uncharacterized protein n=1 Tax=Trichonephila clavata TaxID=2740835 RepID=A0A8X6LSK1_TRICU|nr:hypothetical protein TNCT_492861 [Trichonephila clavata]
MTRAYIDDSDMIVSDLESAEEEHYSNISVSAPPYFEFPFETDISLVERTLLVNLFYENKENASAAVREIRRRKNLLHVTMSTKGIRTMIKSFEKAEKLRVNLEEAGNVSHWYLWMASRQLLAHSHRYQSLRVGARV